MNNRPARPEDLPAIVAIYNQAVAQRGATADLEPVTVEGRRAWFEAHGSEDWPITVAEIDGEVAGWCSLSPYRPGRMALRRLGEISYYVHADRRRCGVARALIGRAMEVAPSLGLEFLVALLLEVNEPSRTLLESCGFEAWGLLPDVARFDDVTCGHLYMGRRLEGRA